MEKSYKSYKSLTCIIFYYLECENVSLRDLLKVEWLKSQWVASQTLYYSYNHDLILQVNTKYLDMFVRSVGLISFIIRVYAYIIIIIKLASCTRRYTINC